MTVNIAHHEAEAENIAGNGTTVRNLLDVLRPEKSIEQFARYWAKTLYWSV
jgi:hypothetical protein